MIRVITLEALDQKVENVDQKIVALEDFDKKIENIDEKIVALEDFWQKSCAAEWFNHGQAANFFLRPPTLKASNLVALWPTDPILLAWKDLVHFPNYTKIKEW